VRLNTKKPKLFSINVGTTAKGESREIPVGGILCSFYSRRKLSGKARALGSIINFKRFILFLIPIIFPKFNYIV